MELSLGDEGAEGSGGKGGPHFEWILMGLGRVVVEAVLVVVKAEEGCVQLVGILEGLEVLPFYAAFLVALLDSRGRLAGGKELEEWHNLKECLGGEEVGALGTGEGGLEAFCFSGEELEFAFDPSQQFVPIHLLLLTHDH